MSMTTPPGWYPDPNAPHTERWWDGTAWTAHSRAAQAPAGAQGQSPYVAGQSHGPGHQQPVASQPQTFPTPPAQSSPTDRKSVV